MFKRASIVAVLMLTVVLPVGARAAFARSTSVSPAPVTASAASAGRASYVMWYRAKRYAGHKRTVKGPVKGTKYASSTSGRPTFINIGRNYPNRRRFTVVIWGKYRSAFPSKPEVLYRGKTVLATGKVRVYKGVAQMYIRSPSKLRIVK
jgi:hypothetical protein